MNIKNYFRFIRSRWFLAAGSLVLGAAIVLGIRFAAYKPDDVHYHANFAVYINGQQEKFQGAQYYTETAACSEDAAITPTERTHMHDNINSVVHVEDHAVTWGNFFQNLGWNLGATYIINASGTVYQENGDKKLHIILNGQDYTNLVNMATTVIKDQDRLLISFGDVSNAALQKEYKNIPSTARHYDVTPDPETCSGHSGTTMHDRFTHML